MALTCGLSGVSGGAVPRKGVLPIIVSSIIKKRRGGRTYLYAATSARVEGRPRIVEQVYLALIIRGGCRHGPGLGFGDLHLRS